LRNTAEPARNGAADRGVVMLSFLLWCLLLVVCWPLALLALIAYPFVWLLLLPFRVVGIAVGGVLEFLRALLHLPARLLGGPARARRAP
jgi:hypothetical protein